jgi:nicotinamide-nucleotide amidase
MTRKIAVDDAALRRLSARVAKKLRAAGETIVTAESCTGGFIAKVLTDLPGSSDYFERGWVTYSNEAKQAELGIEARTLSSFGAVSETVAVAMARGALKHSKAHHAIAVTGIAGPAGGSKARPVGLVWIAWGYRRGGRARVHATGYRFAGGRDSVRRWTVVAALKGLLEP